MAEKFKLQTLLKYRKTLEDQAQQRLAELLNAEAQMVQQQGEICAKVEKLTRQLEEKQRSGLSVLELRLYEDQIVYHRQRSEQLRRQLEELALLIDQRRGELVAAARERKMIEKLKEKQLAEYLSTLDRKERILLDEISLRQKGGSA